MPTPKPRKLFLAGCMAATCAGVCADGIRQGQDPVTLVLSAIFALGWGFAGATLAWTWLLVPVMSPGKLAPKARWGITLAGCLMVAALLLALFRNR